MASYAPKGQKLSLIQEASGKFDIVKLFLRLAWEIKSLDNKKYTGLSEKLDEVGRMFGGWLKNSQKETPPYNK